MSNPVYEPIVRTTAGDYSATALVGTHTVILGWNIEARSRDRRKLHGFAVQRKKIDPATGEVETIEWLNGEKRFRCAADAGVSVRSDQAPFQRFRWSDYAVNAAFVYEYSIFPMLGRPCQLERGAPLVLKVRPAVEDDGTLGVYFNRGVTSAHAYLERFKNRAPKEVGDAAYTWLSRGLKESLLRFIEETKAGQGLHVCIYEFHDHDVAHALREALDRGVKVEIVHHAIGPDKAAVENDEVLAEANLPGVAFARTAPKLSHNKIVIRLNASGRATAVWAGSANFSEAGFYLQTNFAVVHHRAAVAALYEEYFQVLKRDPALGRKTADTVFCQDELEDLVAKGRTKLNGDPGDVFFSPVRNLELLDTVNGLIGEAQRCVFLSAPFGLDASIMTALGANGEEIVEYGLANVTAKKKIESLNRKNTRFFVPSRLETFMGKAWDAKAFGSHKIHSKSLVIDPWGDAPAVLLGSANFSDESCKKNDENAVLIRGDQRLAAIVTTEFLRMFDHYKSRGFINSIAAGSAGDDEFLKENPEEWQRTSFDETSRSHKFRDRIVFAGL